MEEAEPGKDQSSVHPQVRRWDGSGGGGHYKGERVFGDPMNWIEPRCRWVPYAGAIMFYAFSRILHTCSVQTFGTCLFIGV